jgi:hypothetical protein
MVINSMQDDVVTDHDPYCAGALDGSGGKKTASWRQQRYVVSSNGTGNAMAGGARGAANDFCDVNGHRAYVTTTTDDDWTCRRLLIPATNVHTCGSGSGDDDDTVSTFGTNARRLQLAVRTAVKIVKFGHRSSIRQRLVCHALCLLVLQI